MPLNSSKRTFDSFSESNDFNSSTSANPPPSKKARDDPEPDSKLWEMISKLPPTTVSKILLQICQEDPSRASHIHAAHRACIAEEQKRLPSNFDSYSKDCWHTLNKKYKQLPPSKQLGIIGDVEAVLSQSRNMVVGEAGPDTRWETRRNALEALRKISKSIMLCEEQLIRHELMKDGVCLGEFAASILVLANRMSEKERERYKEEGLYEKLVELRTECSDWQTDMKGLGDIFELFDRNLDGDDVEIVEEDTKASGRLKYSKSIGQPRPEYAAPQRTRVFSVIELD